MILGLEQMLSQISTVSFGLERYYNFLELLEQLQEIGAEGVTVHHDAILTPYYVESGSRLELYAFELHIEASTLTGDALIQHCVRHFLSEEVRADVTAVLHRDGRAAFDPEKLYFSYFDTVENEFK